MLASRITSQKTIRRNLHRQTLAGGVAVANDNGGFLANEAVAPIRVSFGRDQLPDIDTTRRMSNTLVLSLLCQAAIAKSSALDQSDD